MHGDLIGALMFVMKTKMITIVLHRNYMAGVDQVFELHVLSLSVLTTVSRIGLQE